MEVSSKVDKTIPQLKSDTHVSEKGKVLANEQTPFPHNLNSESVEVKNDTKWTAL